MNSRFSLLIVATTLTIAGCTGKPGPSPTDFPDATISTGTGGEGAGPTGTSGDTPAANPENPENPASDK